MIARWLAIFLALCCAAYAVLAEPEVSITIRYPVSSWPNGFCRARFTIEPHADNTGVWLGYVGPEDHRSWEQLDARSPRTRWREFKDLPPGEYEAVAELIRVTEGKDVRRTARVGFRVIGLF